MTPDEFAKAAQAIVDESNGDPESLHGRLDDLLCKALEEAGYGEGVAIFNSQTLWYA